MDAVVGAGAAVSLERIRHRRAADQPDGAHAAAGLIDPHSRTRVVHLHPERRPRYTDVCRPTTLAQGCGTAIVGRNGGGSGGFGISATVGAGLRVGAATGGAGGADTRRGMRLSAHALAA